ncbi:MAG: hypothetical protein Crog4KO_33310 [Crocinitomicaceae bacterium]
MGKLRTSFVLKKYKGEVKQVMMYLNFGYKEYDSLKDKYSYKPLRYYTGIQIKTKEWDSELKQVRNRKVQSELDFIESSAVDIFNYLSGRDVEITPELLRDELDSKLKGTKTEIRNVIRIVDFIKTEIVENNTSRSKRTLDSYKDLARKLETFEKKYNLTVTIQNLDESIYLKFMQEMRERFNKLNSVWSVYKTFRAVLNEISRKYKIEVFNPTKELSMLDKPRLKSEEKIYLNPDQIKTLLDYEPKTERLQNVKLAFLTLLFTGCRFSDINKIKPEFEYNKNGVRFQYARFFDQKTQTDIIAPILKPLKDAHNKYGTLQKISKESFNTGVKDLLKLAKLNEEVKLSYTDSNGNKNFENRKFYECVSSHTGRRSFVTNLINFIPVTILSKITGHSLTSNSVIFGYNKISLLDNAVLFVKELERVTQSNSKDFPFKWM